MMSCIFVITVQDELIVPKIIILANIAIFSAAILFDVCLKKFDFFDARNIFLIYFFLQFILWPIFVIWGGQTRRPIPIDDVYL